MHCVQRHPCAGFPPPACLPCCIATAVDFPQAADLRTRRHAGRCRGSARSSRVGESFAACCAPVASSMSPAAVSSTQVMLHAGVPASMPILPACRCGIDPAPGPGQASCQCVIALSGGKLAPGPVSHPRLPAALVAAASLRAPRRRHTLSGTRSTPPPSTLGHALPAMRLTVSRVALAAVLRCGVSSMLIPALGGAAEASPWLASPVACPWAPPASAQVQFLRTS